MGRVVNVVVVTAAIGEVVVEALRLTVVLSIMTMRPGDGRRSTVSLLGA